MNHFYWTAFKTFFRIGAFTIGGGYVMLPMVIGPVIGDKACQSAAQTIINEAGAEVIVPAKDMFLWAGIVCIFALIPLYFLVKKGVDSVERKEETESAI